MPRRIEGDWFDFRQVYGGKIRRALQKFIKNGSIFRTRGDGGKINITIPRIDIPHIVFGSGDGGVGRGKGKPGDVIGRDDDGQGQGNKPGTESADGITIAISMEDILRFMKNELELPDLKPKANQVFEEVKIKYNNIAKTGPESLRHTRRTMMQALKRMSASGEINVLHKVPGFADPVKLITPINSDRRYRQYKEIKIPSSNAVIFFARDGSGSMDQYKCDVVSDMAWWIDVWIRSFYKRVERCYIWHDTVAQEVDEDKFYNYRYGGGTVCSSALQLISKQLENRFPPEKWNIYVFYFTDGENAWNDNSVFNEILKKQFPPEIANRVCVTQILAWQYENSLKKSVDESNHNSNIRTTFIGNESSSPSAPSWIPNPGNAIGEEERNQQIRRAIIDLLGLQKGKSSSASLNPASV